MVSLPCITKAVIFDVDGTLYDQRKLRLLMAWEMVICVLRQPGRIAELRILRHFRRMREKLGAEASFDLEGRQYVWPAQAPSRSPEKVRKLLQDWRFERPIAYLPSWRYPNTQALLAQLQQQGIPAGVFPDYPGINKLGALGLIARVVVSATRAEFNRRKPDPAGLPGAVVELGAPVPECSFMGGREAKDGECAWLAGMPGLILASRGKNRQLHGFAAWLRDAEQN
jgi:phosphoglycolate phosphatase-like HAD superfamily hydrolase